MVFKLAKKNIKVQFHNYLVYLISMVFAVIVYYCFSAITYNRPLITRAGQEIRVDGARRIGGLLVIVMIIGFMFAINHFFLLRREKEIGLYHLLGMRKSQISLLFLTETLILGLLSLVAGISLGIIFSKLFSMILAKAMFLNVDSLFFVSIPSMIQTSIIFIFMLLVVSVRSSWLVSRYELSRFFKTNEERMNRSGNVTKKKVIFGVLGLLLILTGYYFSYNIVPIGTLLLRTSLGFLWLILAPLLIMLICIVGTFLFFKNTIYLIVYFFSKNKQSYYRGLTMLAFGNTKRHIDRSSNTLTSITLFIAVALSMIGGAASFYTIGMHSVNVTDPTDFIVSSKQFNSVKGVIEKQGDSSIKETADLEFKVIGSRYFYKIDGVENRETVEPMNVIALSNYLAYQRINPYLKTVSLENETQAVMLDSDQVLLKGFVHYDRSINLAGGYNLKIVQIKPDYLGEPMMRYSIPTIVVQDQLYKKLNSDAVYHLTAFNIETKNDEELTSNIAKTVKNEWINPVYYDLNWQEGQVKGKISLSQRLDNKEEYGTNRDTGRWQLNYTSRFPDLRYQRKEMGLFIYVAMFLGILALIITGSILMVRQFSEAEQEKSSYDLLKKIGIPKNQITKLIYQQNILIFFPPMLIGILHAVFAIYIFSRFVQSSGYWLAYLSCGILIMIYVIYYLLTSALYSRIVHGRANR